MSEEHLRRRREQILAAAARCFARGGFHRSTMEDIVRETRLSPGAIYRYFASKEDIVTAIATRRHAAEREVARGAAARLGCGSRLRDLARAFLAPLADRREQEWRRVTVQLWGEALLNRRVKAIVDEGLREPLRALAALVRRGQHEGHIPRALQPTAAARVGAAIFQGLVLQQAWDPGLDVAACLRVVEALLEALAAPAIPRRRRGRRRSRAHPGAVRLEPQRRTTKGDKATTRSDHDCDSIGRMR